jgi:hypothetical protein
MHLDAGAELTHFECDGNIFDPSVNPTRILGSISRPKSMEAPPSHAKISESYVAT